MRTDGGGERSGPSALLSLPHAYCSDHMWEWLSGSPRGYCASCGMSAVGDCPISRPLLLPCRAGPAEHRQLPVSRVVARIPAKCAVQQAGMHPAAAAPRRRRALQRQHPPAPAAAAAAAPSALLLVAVLALSLCAAPRPAWAAVKYDKDTDAGGGDLMTPQRGELMSRRYYFEIPHDPVGVLFMAHGCVHDAADFWPPSDACPECSGGGGGPQVVPAEWCFVG